MLVYHEENNVSVSLVFLKNTKSQTLDKVIVSHIVYGFHVVQSKLVSILTSFGVHDFPSATVLLAVLAVKHKYGNCSSLRIYTHMLLYSKI